MSEREAANTWIGRSGHDGGRATASVAVSNSMVAAAIRATLSSCGWSVSARADATLHVTDEPSARTARDDPGGGQVIVCDPTPYSARGGLDALTNLNAVGLVIADEPSDLTAVLVAVRAERVSLPRRLLDLAALMPHLTDRQVRILSAIAAGQTNPELCRGLHLAPTSVKREIAVLYEALRVATRPAIAARAFDLGIVARRVSP